MEGRRAKKETFTWAKPEAPEVISYDPPKDDFYKARISALEAENMKLRAELEKRAEWYGMGKDAFDARHNEMADEIAKLRDENTRLRTALIREAIRDV